MGDKEVGPWLGDGSNRSVWVRPAALAHQHSACETVSCYGARGSDAGSPRSGERAGARAGKHLCDVAEKAGGSPKVSAPKADLESLPPAAQRASCAGIQLCRDPAVGGIQPSSSTSCAGIQLCSAPAVHGPGCVGPRLDLSPAVWGPATNLSSCARLQLRWTPTACVPALRVRAVSPRRGHPRRAHRGCPASRPRRAVQWSGASADGAVQLCRQLCAGRMGAAAG